MAIPQDEAKTNAFLIVFACKNCIYGREDPNLQILTKILLRNEYEKSYGPAKFGV
jgi:hypothetical protein